MCRLQKHAEKHQCQTKDTETEQRQRSLLAKMKSEAAAITTKPGSQGIALHTSLDGTRLIVYAIWDSIGVFTTAIANNEEAIANRNILAQYGESSANTYRVDSVSQPIQDEAGGLICS
jgi:hypothetical protein